MELVLGGLQCLFGGSSEDMQFLSLLAVNASSAQPHYDGGGELRHGAWRVAATKTAVGASQVVDSAAEEAIEAPLTFVRWSKHVKHYQTSSPFGNPFDRPSRRKAPPSNLNEKRGVFGDIGAHMRGRCASHTRGQTNEPGAVPAELNTRLSALQRVSIYGCSMAYCCVEFRFATMHHWSAEIMDATSNKCNDAAFGPVVASTACRGGFDFTGSNLRKLPYQSYHQAAIVAYFSIQLAILVQQSLQVTEASQSATASAAIGLIATTSLGVLSILEHRNTSRPSFLISVYLILSILFDIVRTRTAWLGGSSRALAGTTTAALALKSVILALETANKRGILLEAYSTLSKEATSGFLSRGLFLWLASLLVEGSKKALTLKDLFDIHEKLDPHTLAEDLGGHHRQHGLAIATLWAWRTELVKVAIPRIMLVALNISQPFIIGAIIDNTLARDTPEIRSRGHGLIGAVIITGFYQHLAFRFIAMTRGGLIGLIYAKLIRSPAGAAETGDSAAITLIESDVEKIGETWFLLTSDLWACILQLGVSIWLLERQIGVIFFTLASVRAAGFMTARQKRWLEAVQRRVNFTAHVLSHMKHVKMLGLSGKMQQIIHNFRIKEIDRSKKYRRLSMNLPDTFGQLVTFAAFAIVARIQNSDAFTLSKAISSISILTILMEPLGQLLYCIPQISAALGCFERIQTFLNSESWRDSRSKPETTTTSLRSNPPGIELCVLPAPRRRESVVVDQATLGWNARTPTLKSISLHLTSDINVTMLMGPVGCGKSTLLKSLLGETIIHSGSVSLSTGNVSYCDQFPWLASGTIQSIIIGASVYCEQLYKAVVHACALETDIASLKDGDQTQIKAQGNTLSGGQKQRIAIARALFSQKPIAIFDDVLSGLDPVTREIVFMRVFGPNGLVRELGIIAILATHATDRLDVADKVVVLDSNGCVVRQGHPEADIQASILDSRSHVMTKSSVVAERLIEAQPEAVEEDEVNQQLRQTGDASIYKFYFKSLGWINFAIFASIVACEAASGTMLYAWISLWSNSADRKNTGYWLGLYATWAILKGIGLFGAVYFIYVVTVPRSASHLHGSVLETAFRAPMSFISQTPTGVLVNRFSQDMRLVDMVLPGNLVSTCFILSSCLGVGALTVVASPYLAAVLPFLVGVLYLLQRFYLRTSRQLRLLELESKAPVTSHVIETIRGTMSIRAYGWEGLYIQKLEALLADCQKPFYLLLCIQRWLGLVLGLVVGILAVLLTTVAVTVRGSSASAGFVGVALVNMMGLSQSLAALITQWTNLETSLGAVSRIKSFSEDTPREAEPEARAAEDCITILHGITMDILGKSSLVTSILGLVDGTAGRIVIDGVDLSAVRGETVRTAVACVTQDPFLFDSSVRDNLDPAEKKTNAEIEAALRRVGLWPVVSSSALNSGQPEDKVLDLPYEELHLSHGQSQLFCLARAMLRDSRVVLLDDVDNDTEKQIYDILDGEFKQSTVIMVTHRLTEIRKFDRVAALNAGDLVEYGRPTDLLVDGESALSALYEAQGPGGGGSSGDRSACD
ncbi:ABC multidrug transporter [Cordyceps javanica]|uniref:ABC multidrug transporter n=1 Tax=Cordyceps javanica TaxID=43265 RepID=A0A545US24_9HYPO|nr:ABC multidrug transporter [Cordyceps javanica]